MYKQAYLIIAHRYDETFVTLLHMLDSFENDIFIHMDKKNTEFSEHVCKKNILKSNIFFTIRTDVSWGGYSQINAELLLIKRAIDQGHYNYYHLLSGQDLPIKSNQYIKDFFMKHQGKEFIAFDSQSFEFYDRVNFYYPLQEIVGRNRNSCLGWCSSLFVYLQKLFHIERNNNIKFQKGSNWFSITDTLARYVIEKKDWIYKTFSNSLCCDEVFLQTLVVNSIFFERVYQYATLTNSEEAALRLIDWKRGGPYVFKKEDYFEILNSNMLFARKFDCKIDNIIIKQISSIQNNIV